MLKRLKTRIMSILLILVMLFCSMGAALTDRETLGPIQVVTEKGITYYVQQSHSKYKTKIKITTDNNLDYTEISIDRMNNTISSTSYDYRNNGLFGTKKYSSTRQTIDYSDFASQPADALILQAISYNSTTKTNSAWGTQYDYAYGSEGTKTYLKIHCNYTYQIRTDNLSTDKNAKCDAYTTAIKKCNSSIAKYYAGVSGAGIATGVLVGLIIVNIVFPPSVIVSIIVAAVGGTAGYVTAIYYAIDSYEYYRDAKDLYVTIRSYGTNISPGHF